MPWFQIHTALVPMEVTPVRLSNERMQNAVLHPSSDSLSIKGNIQQPRCCCDLMLPPANSMGVRRHQSRKPARARCLVSGSAVAI